MATNLARRDFPPPRTRPTPRWPWLALLAATLAIALGAGLDRWRTGDARAALDPTELRPGFGPPSYAAALARTERTLAERRAGLARFPGEWLREEIFARALMARFRLAGDYADLAEAQRVLDRAIVRAPEPAGPVLTRALLSLQLHRLADADQALARFTRSVAPDPSDSADAEALAGDVALQRGRLDEAARHFAKAGEIAGTPGIDLRTAVLAFHRGESEAGKRAVEALLAKPRQPPALLAELALQRANMAYAEGDWDGAARWVDAARRVFPGHWLADAYAAQNEALAGRPRAAIERYRALATRTGRPEVADALAHLLRLEGQAAASKAWAARAEAGWEARAARFPEAVAQHRAEHELAVGSAARALALTEADVAARPQPTGIALLARALILSGRPREALAWIVHARRQGWVSAGLFMLEAEAYAALGDQPRAEAA
ncbi:MAG TPA: hypothetical protein VM055_06830, partial [Novosphingobium sp.]|nr:hypothetical protein [Novosphingobium sp.]